MNPLLWADTLENIIIFLKNDTDLRSLMRTCTTIQNIVGHSNIWKKIDPSLQLESFGKYVVADEAFQLFASIKLGTRFVKLSKFTYGRWYYLYVLKNWSILDISLSWNFLDLTRNKDDLRKICQISSLMSETRKVIDYHNWIEMIPDVYDQLEVMSRNFSPDELVMRDKILGLIYLNSFSYQKENEFTVIGLRNYKLKCKFNERDDLFPDTFCYQIKYMSCFAIANNTTIFEMVASDDMPLKLSSIADELEVDSEMFIKIIGIILGKSDTKNRRMFEEILGIYELPDIFNIPDLNRFNIGIRVNRVPDYTYPPMMVYDSSQNSEKLE